MDARDWIAHRDDLSLLVGLMERLALEPASRYRASLLGGDAWFGWSLETDMQSNQLDATYALITAAGWRRPKYKQLAPRPDVGAKKTLEVRATSVAALDWGTALSGM